VEQLLEEGERVTVAEDDAGDRRAVGSLVGAKYLRAEPLDQRGSDGIVGGEEMVDDLVARDCRGTVPAECLQRGRLARPDATGDRYRDRPGNVRAGQGSPYFAGSSSETASSSTTAASTGSATSAGSATTVSGSTDAESSTST
jgi:hypothetical protein